MSVRRVGSGCNAEVSGPSFEPIGDRVGAPSVREPRGCAFVRGQRGLCGEGCMMRERPGSCAAGGACDPKSRKKSQMAVGSKPKEGEKGKKNLYLWF